ncbi:Microtubule-associated protein RP/EB member 1 [Clonorchis sinensis]|uniref:Microtubule-associated protein RP/EB member 1 n=1 Tax=Clonorchis sinensis TaxID=79923 RepID=A0A8T1N0X7_CLOSI|nr:Microtubule-associated protein RP/EB member 1 [Clonorchis sinensis]
MSALSHSCNNARILWNTQRGSSMSDYRIQKAVNVHIVTNNTTHLTKRDVLTWLGSFVKGHLKRIEDLSSGCIYCIIMNEIFPGSIPLNRVKFNVKTESEAAANFKLLLNAFRMFEVRKDIPVDNLIRGVFSENFRFAQWFKLFYDANITQARSFDEFGDQEPYEAVPGHIQHSTRRPYSDSTRECRKAEDRDSQRPPIYPDSARQNRFFDQIPVRMDHGGPRTDVHEEGEEVEEPTDDEFVQNNARTPQAHDLSQPPNPDGGRLSSEEHEFTGYFTSNEAPQFCHPEGSGNKRFTETNSDNRLVQTASVAKRRSNSFRSSKNYGDKLPPPSPLPANQCGLVGNHTGRGTATQKQAVENLLASGDRPMSAVMASADALSQIQTRLPESSRTVNALHAPSSVVEEESVNTTVSNSSRKVMPKHTARANQRMNNPTAPNVSSNVFLSTPSKPITRPPAYPQHIFDPRPGDLTSSGLGTEAELQRELALLRYGSLEQRRTLFYCQKEAQFYFSKLRKIEDFCYRLKTGSKQALEDILDTIFGILYETEEGFVCPDELPT